MPCGDITEKISVVLDSGNRIKSYSFSKKTCGGSIGDDDIIKIDIIDQTAENVIKQHQYGFMQKTYTGDEIVDFLKVKHFLAIKSVLNVYLGNVPGGVGNACTITKIEYDIDSTIIHAEINSNLDAVKVKSCDHCGPD